MLKAALFDLDGTLCDTEDQYTTFWGEQGRKYHPEIPDFAHVIKGTTLKQIIERYFPSEEDVKKLLPALLAWEAQMKYTFFPGALDFIKDLKDHGVKCAVVTSSDKTKMANVKKQIPELEQIFDRILTSEDFKASKPNPDCFLKGAQTFGCDTSECVVFEDAFTGLEAGMASGIFTIGLPTTNSREAITGKCHYVLDSFQDFSYDRLLAVIQH